MKNVMSSPLTNLDAPNTSMQSVQQRSRHTDHTAPSTSPGRMRAGAVPAPR